MIGEISVFGLSLMEAAVIVALISYVVSLFRDWRPIKALRQENGELRRTIAEQQERIGKQDARIAELEHELARVKRATDLSPIAEQQLKGIEVLTQLVTEIKALDGSVRANTAAVEMLSKRRIIDEALEEGGKK